MMDFQSDPTKRNYWRRCSSCKKAIPFGANYQHCSVSTCHSNKRTGLVFCSVECWDAHLGFANHRSAEAEEVRAPNRDEFLLELETESGSNQENQPQRRIIRESATQNTQTTKVDVDTLVVVSKVKAFIRDKSGFNTSQCAIDALTQKVVDECFKAMETARNAGRKTVMGRDF